MGRFFFAITGRLLAVDLLDPLPLGESALAALVLDVVAVGEELAVPHELAELLLGELGEAPVLGDVDLLAAGELHLGSPESLDGVVLVGLFAPDGHQGVADLDTGDEAVGLAVSAPHSGLEPISTGAGKHLVNPGDVVRVSPDPKVES